jgi:hypothetical protein
MKVSVVSADVQVRGRGVKTYFTITHVILVEWSIATMLGRIFTANELLILSHAILSSENAIPWFIFQNLGSTTHVQLLLFSFTHLHSV